MTRQFFSGCVQVEIQGPKVLRLLQRTIQNANYEIVGFEGKVILHDIRAQGLLAINYLESSGDASYFPDEFSSPAYAKIYTDDEGVLRIHLSDCEDRELDHILWIAIGISDEIPLYNYEHQWIEYLGSDQIGMIAVFAKSPVDDSEEFFLPTYEEIPEKEVTYVESFEC